jgi:DNA invertase Pin-like site-specific DNA recombinase
MAERYAVGYIRRSSADDSNPGEVSQEAQEAAVAAVAAREAVSIDPKHLYKDWGRSADEAKESQRVEFAKMLAAIGRGEVSVVCAASLDRLYRSMRTFVRLTDAAKAHDTRIVTQREGVLGGDGSPMARAFAEITAVFSSLELNTIKARNKAALEGRQRRGDKFGVAPYGKRVVRDADGRALKPIIWEDDPERPIGPVLDAYRKAGSVLGACHLLEASHVPTAHGNLDWHPSALTLILAREGVLPPRGRRRQVSRSAFFAGLIHCTCGATMTPDRGKGGYYCRFAKWRRATHGPGGWVREDRLMPIIRAEAARLRVPYDAFEEGRDDPRKRADLAERKRRLGLAFAATALDEATFRDELEKIEKEAARVDAAAEIVAIPPVDWSKPPATVAASLRALFLPIQLAPDGTITAVLWRVPEWRGEPMAD